MKIVFVFGKASTILRTITDINQLKAFFFFETLFIPWLFLVTLFLPQSSMNSEMFTRGLTIRG